jgi:carboxyl-terminal processing protease
VSLPGLDGRLTVVVPAAADALTRRLLQAELGELSTALGVPVDLADEPPPDGARWIVEDATVPRLTWDEDTRTLRTAGGIGDGLHLLHTLVRQAGAPAEARPCATPEEVVERIVDEVGGSYPGFALRELDWPRLCARHRPAVLASGAALPELERWIAELADIHTAVRRTGPRYHPPYAARDGRDGVVLVRVPEGTAAHRTGVRPGWRLDDTEPDLSVRTGAPAHVRPLLAGRRALEQRAPERERAATSPDGRRVSWLERVDPLTADDNVVTRTLDRDTGYLRLRGFLPGTADAVDAELARLRGRRRLVLDLRGNTGGLLVEATAVRDRFLREPTELGSIAYTDGNGRSGSRLPLTGHPAGTLWGGELVVVTDGLTASAAEDLLLGLQGLPHVLVVGEPSAGGSGRARTVPLTDDLVLSVSTALTYDRRGRCVEGNGIPVDVPAEAFDGDVAIEVARAR